MYDEEARGNRLLERARLSPEHQRLALIGSRYSLNFTAILESLCMSFPEHKPPPALFGKDGNPTRAFTKSPSASSSSSSLSSMSTASSYKSDRSGISKGKGKFKPRQAYAAEHQELETADEGAENNEEKDTPENEGDGNDDAAEEEQDDNPDEEAEDELDLGGVAEVLTVAAKKLQSLTLGRKFSGTRSIADRKRSSHCSACGEVGHWAGDAEYSKLPRVVASRRARTHRKAVVRARRNRSRPKRCILHRASQRHIEEHTREDCGLNTMQSIRRD